MPTRIGWGLWGGQGAQDRLGRGKTPRGRVQLALLRTVHDQAGGRRLMAAHPPMRDGWMGMHPNVHKTRTRPGEPGRGWERHSSFRPQDPMQTRGEGGLDSLGRRDTVEHGGTRLHTWKRQSCRHQDGQGGRATGRLRGAGRLHRVDCSCRETGPLAVKMEPDLLTSS